MAESNGTRILEGVERVGWQYTHVLCFPGSLAAAMRYLGEDVSNEYVLGVSGGAFKLFWLAPWAPSNCDLLVYGEEPVRRAFAALGYSYSYLPDYDRSHPAFTREFYQDKIVRSVDSGKPAIAIGVVGPPEACLITGYEDGGDVLHGTSYFQEDGDGRFRADDWYPNIYGLILVGEKVEKPSPSRVLRDTLEWAIHLVRTPSFGESEWNGPDDPAAPTAGTGVFRHSNGLAAFDTMADLIRRDEEFHDLSPQDIEMRCFAIGHDGVYLLEAEREAAAAFLEGFAREGLPDADDLLRAAEAYRAEAGVLKEATQLAPVLFIPPEQIRQRMEPEPRRALAGLLCRAKGIEEQAVEHLEQALKAFQSA